MFQRPIAWDNQPCPIALSSTLTYSTFQYNLVWYIRPEFCRFADLDKEADISTNLLCMYVLEYPASLPEANVTSSSLMNPGHFALTFHKRLLVHSIASAPYSEKADCRKTARLEYIYIVLLSVPRG